MHELVKCKRCGKTRFEKKIISKPGKKITIIHCRTCGCKLLRDAR